MIAIVSSKQFLKEVSHLPVAQRQKLSTLLEMMKIQPNSPLLHTKLLTGELSGIYSFRIGREWRVLYRFANKHTIELIRVAHRKDIYR